MVRVAMMPMVQQAARFRNLVLPSSRLRDSKLALFDFTLNAGQEGAHQQGRAETDKALREVAEEQERAVSAIAREMIDAGETRWRKSRGQQIPSRSTNPLATSHQR